MVPIAARDEQREDEDVMGPSPPAPPATDACSPQDAYCIEAERLAPAPPVAERPVGRGLRQVIMDVGPLRRHRDFRLLWFGESISYFGSMVTFVAVPYQAYALTHSSLVVGLLSAAQLVPLVVMALFGGALADALDRRKLVLIAELFLAGASGALLANALVAHPQLWVLFVVGAVMAGLGGLQRPPLDALLPRLVERDELVAAAALMSLRRTVGMIAGPALGGVLIAALGVESAYIFDIATFVISLVMLALMHAVPPPSDAPSPTLRGIVEGFRYAAGRQELIGTYGVDMVAMFFGMPMALFPALAQKLGGAGVLGLLYAAPSVGAFVASLTSGWAPRVRRQGAAVGVAAVGWGVGVVALGFAPGLVVALAALAFAGYCDMISGIFRSAIWNQTIPDRLRGRLAGIEQISYTTGPLMGNVEAGAVAALAGLRASIVSGGVLCIVGVGVAVAVLPKFWRYDARRWADAAARDSSVAVGDGR
jgi:MFS family permease